MVPAASASIRRSSYRGVVDSRLTHGPCELNARAGRALVELDDSGFAEPSLSVGPSGLRCLSVDPNAAELICDRAVVADLKKIQDDYLRQTDRVTLEERRALRLPRRALENLARLTASLL